MHSDCHRTQSNYHFSSFEQKQVHNVSIFGNKNEMNTHKSVFFFLCSEGFFASISLSVCFSLVVFLVICLKMAEYKFSCRQRTLCHSFALHKYPGAHTQSFVHQMCIVGGGIVVLLGQTKI